MTGGIGLVLYVVVIALNISFRQETVRFLAEHAVITDSTSLEAFKNLARRNMKAVFPLTAVFLLAPARTRSQHVRV